MSCDLLLGFAVLSLILIFLDFFRLDLRIAWVDLIFLDVGRSLDLGRFWIVLTAVKGRDKQD
jgi:hypothetical protein